MVLNTHGLYHVRSKSQFSSLLLMGKKWFDSSQKRSPTTAIDLVPISGTGEVEAADIEQLLIELKTHRADAATAAFFAMLGQLRPGARLARNLKSLVRLMADDEVQTVLRDGIDPGEREALCQLEVLGLATKEKLTAQRLLNIEERFQLHRVLADVFRRARTRRGGCLTTGDQDGLSRKRASGECTT